MQPARSSGSVWVAAQRARLELRVTRLVALLGAVAVLVQDGALGVDEHRAERFVAVVEGFARELDAAAQVGQVGIVERHAVIVADGGPDVGDAGPPPVRSRCSRCTRRSRRARRRRG